MLVAAFGEHPAWSPDGDRIALDVLRCDFYFVQCSPDGVYVATLDGVDLVFAVPGRNAVWRPQRRQ